MNFLHKTWAEIDLSALKHNLIEIKKAIGSTPLMAVVKANAYGHSVKTLAPFLEQNGADAFAVSNLLEAIELRECGIKKPILILGYTPTDAVGLLYKNDIIQAVYSPDYAAALNKAAEKENIKIKIHIKLDTGMGRIGFNCRNDKLLELSDAITAASLPNFLTCGIFTHFAESDRTKKNDDDFTEAQHTRFKTAAKAFKDAGFKDISCHCSNSAAICLDSDKRYDFCRAGIILYGLTPNPELKLNINLSPVMSFKTVVTMVKKIDVGDTVSYGRTFTAENPMLTATLAAGYADGYPRLLSNKGYVLIKGQKAAIIGRVCMDQFTVDISNIEGVEIGDEALLFGKDLPVEEIAELSGTINYEIITNIAPRVPRVIVE
ncbi:MAG: alanine racemase [Ruminococcaceae bacterium]|nr:alanine racemase [Oscillospiraceae bacterium]